MIIEIPLTQGQVTLVDEEDYLTVLKHKWCAWYNKCTDSYYVKTASRVEGKKTILNMHRYLLGLVDRGRCVDHINGNTLDNRRANLRICTTAQNTKNHTKLKKSNKSGFRGVCWVTEKRKWKAFITINYKHKHLGYFDDPSNAAKAFDRAALHYYGEFHGRLNFGKGVNND